MHSLEDLRSPCGDGPRHADHTAATERSSSGSLHDHGAPATLLTTIIVRMPSTLVTPAVSPPAHLSNRKTVGPWRSGRHGTRGNDGIRSDGGHRNGATMPPDKGGGESPFALAEIPHKAARFVSCRAGQVCLGYPSRSPAVIGAHHAGGAIVPFPA
jgi:hypothetical protein